MGSLRRKRPRYPYEVEVYGDGKNYVVDSYIPGSEIVSREFTQLASVKESTGIGYLNESQKKYPSGAIITDSPFNPKVLRGKTMTGNLILEIPEQKGPIPQSVIDYANNKGIIIRDVNTAISHRQAKHRGAMYRKSDSDDAEAIALATLNMLDRLPDACTNDTYWSLGQLVHRRDNIMKQRTRLVNQLHEQLCIAYPSYKQFFNDISRPTALYFWEHYPSRKYLKGKSVDDLNIDYQDARDMVTLSIVSDLQHYDKQLAEVDKMLEKMYDMLHCTLTTIPGVSIITAVKILSEIGDIKRFGNANKLAQFVGIAPLHLSSSGKGKDIPSDAISLR